RPQRTVPVSGNEVDSAVALTARSRPVLPRPYLVKFVRKLRNVFDDPLADVLELLPARVVIGFVGPAVQAGKQVIDRARRAVLERLNRQALRPFHEIMAEKQTRRPETRHYGAA